MTVHKARIAYVLKGFPRLSESFIANEVRILSRMGLTLGLFSIKRGDELAFDASLPPVHYLPSVSSMSQITLRAWLVENFCKFSACQYYWLRTHPIRYIRTLSFAAVCAFRYRKKSASRLKKTFLKQFLLATHIAREIDQAGDYSHIHAHFCHDSTTVAWMVSKLAHLPFSFTAHAKDIYKQDLNPGRLLEEKIAAASFAVTCTKANVEHLQERSRAPGKIHGIYHGLNLNAFVRGDDEPHRMSYSPKTPARLLAVGRLVEKKGFIFLIEACRILRDRGVSFHLDIVGEDGDQSALLSSAVRQYDLCHHVNLRAPMPQPELVNYYQSATVFVLPCIVLDDGDRDGIPNVMAEAMACSLPVVVTEISGIPELVENAVNGVLVPARDAQTLANAIEQLIRNPQMRSELGAAARQTIEVVFDAEATHTQLKRIFDDVLAA